MGRLHISVLRAKTGRRRQSNPSENAPPSLIGYTASLHVFEQDNITELGRMLHRLECAMVHEHGAVFHVRIGFAHIFRNFRPEPGVASPFCKLLQKRRPPPVSFARRYFAVVFGALHCWLPSIFSPKSMPPASSRIFEMSSLSPIRLSFSGEKHANALGNRTGLKLAEVS